MSPYQDKIETQQWQADKLEYCFQMLLITKGQVLYSFFKCACLHAWITHGFWVTGQLPLP